MLSARAEDWGWYHLYLALNYHGPHKLILIKKLASRSIILGRYLVSSVAMVMLYLIFSPPCQSLGASFTVSNLWIWSEPQFVWANGNLWSFAGKNRQTLFLLLLTARNERRPRTIQDTQECWEGQVCLPAFCRCHLKNNCFIAKLVFCMKGNHAFL